MRLSAPYSKLREKLQAKNFVNRIRSGYNISVALHGQADGAVASREAIRGFSSHGL